MKTIKQKSNLKRRGVLKGDMNLLNSREVRAVRFLLDYGIDVKIIPPSRHKKSADFWIERQYWELKSPTGTSRHTIEHAFKKGAKQAEHIIFDARQSPKNDTVFFNEVVRAMQSSSTVKSVWIILKSGELRRISKKEALKLARKEA